MLFPFILWFVLLQSGIPDLPELPPIVHCDVIIDAGHGGVDGGTSSNDGILEKKVNLQIAKKLYEKFHRQGLCVVLDRTGDYALSEENHWHKTRSRHRRDLAQRKQLTHEIDAKLLISLHVNWSSSKNVRGALVIYNNRNASSFLLGNLLQKHLNQYYGISHRPVPGNRFYLLKHSRCPAVIVELGYISNRSDRALLTSDSKQNQIAAVLAGAVNQYLNLNG